jgi:hypothetical protein
MDNWMAECGTRTEKESGKAGKIKRSIRIGLPLASV